MSRVAAQTDLFALSAEPSQPAPRPDPVAELQAFLAEMRAHAEMPWGTIYRAMQVEYRLLRLIREAGPAAADLAEQCRHEFERLMATTD